MPVLGLLVLVGLVATGFMLTRKSEALPSGGPVGRFLGQLRKGQLYRVWVRVPSGALTQADLQSRVESMGFSDTKLVTPDPTDRGVATLITRWMLDSSEVFDTPEVKLFQLEAVQEPPAAVKTSGDETSHPALDGGLTGQDIEAIKWALISDDDAKHLGGFASTFEPDFPIAASLLRTKAALANARSMGSVLAGEAREKSAKMVERFKRAATAVGVGLGADDWAQRLSSSTLETLKKLTDKLVPGETWEKYRAAIASLGPFIPAHRMWMADKAFSILKQVAQAPRDIGEEGETYAKHVCEVCPALALVPGLGSGISCMRAVGAALSVSTSLEFINMPDVAACLEGQSEATAFMTAATLVGDFARGKPAPAEGLFELLTSERQAMTEKEKVAFDAGVALGFGRALQATDFPALWSYVTGDTLPSRAVRFAVAVGKAKRDRQRPVAVLLATIGKELPPGAINAVRKLAVDLVANPKLLSLYPSELAKEKEVPVPVAAAALAVVREIGEGIRIVDPNALRMLCPDEPMFTLGLTPASLKLAMSMTKPYVSQVVDPGGIVPKVREIAKSTAPEGVKARRQLERAVKALERQRWADWYRKVQAEGASRGNVSGASLESGQLTRSA